MAIEIPASATTPDQTFNRVDFVAQRFHEEYERLAPAFGWVPQTESSKPWDEVPERNKGLMRAVVASLIVEGVI